MRRARTAGARWDRVEFDPGMPWARIDRMFAADYDNGLRILPLLNRYERLTPANRDRFVRWATRFMGRYGAGGSYWKRRDDGGLAPMTFELFNEVYATWWGDIGWPDAAGYADVFRRVAEAGRRLDPGYRFLLSAVHTIEQDGAPVEWATALTDADPRLGDVVDGLAVHPYGERVLVGDANNSYAATRRVRASFAAAGIDKPVWITEVGVCTSPQASRSLCGDEREQADAVRFYFGDLRATPWIAGLFVYGWRDAGTGDRSDPHRWYGLLTHAGRPKAGLAAFRDEARR